MPLTNILEPLPAHAASFPQFPALPAEIRRLIWQAAVLPRIVYLELVFEGGYKCSRVWSQTSVDGPGYMRFFDLDNQPDVARAGFGPRRIWGFRSRSVPVLFYVCIESYNVAMNIYSKSFGTSCMAPKTWFNFELDTLFFDQRSLEDEDEDEDDDAWQNPLQLLEGISDDVKLVRNLALYNETSDQMEFFIHQTLRHFGNVQSLTMVPSMKRVTDFTTLVYLEEKEAFEYPGYTIEGEVDYHPTYSAVFSELVDDFSHNYLWVDGDTAWSLEHGVFSIAERLNELPLDGENSEQLKWVRPCLYFKPIVTSQQKVDFLHRKHKFDTERDAREVPLTLTTRMYGALEVSVPLLTTTADLVSIFCQAKGIDISRNGDSKDNQPSVYRCDGNRWASRRNPTGSLFSMGIGPRLRTDGIRFCIHFRQGDLQRSKNSEENCEERQCRHEEKLERVFWMETEGDWGVREMFASV